LRGKRLKGDFALIHIKARRSGSKGNEWLLIKKKDGDVVPGFDIDTYETSILTDRTMNQISGDEGSAEWKSSRPAARGGVKAAWLVDTVARVDAKRNAADPESKVQSKVRNKAQSKAKPESGQKKAAKKAASVKKKSSR
jgi:hypothetical protein